MNVLEGLVCVTLMQTVPIQLETSHVHATLATVGMDLYAQVSYTGMEPAIYYVQQLLYYGVISYTSLVK